MCKDALKHDDEHTSNHEELVLNEKDGQLALKGKAKTNWICSWRVLRAPLHFV